METYPTWIRLHPESTDDTMVTSVQARMHDPLWLLGRQWQFGELRHDAGATPVDVRVEGVVSPLTRLRSGVPAADETGTAAIDIDTTRVPLETLAEREAVPEERLDNLRLRTEAGLHLVRTLRAAGLADRVAFWVARSPFPLPDPPGTHETLDPATREWLTLVSGRVPDGGGLLSAIPRQLAPQANGDELDPRETEVLRGWLAWAGARFAQPPAGSPTWDDEHMEYAFSVGARKAAGEAVLVAPEYREGRLDWYDFEEGEGTLGSAGQTTPHRAYRIPAPLDFAGMPNPRFWTFEDPAVRFDALEILAAPNASPSSVTLMVLDFALSYSDDWFLVPLTLNAWTAFEATTVAVTDVFGDIANAEPPDGRWNMFRLDAKSGTSGLSRLFLAASPADADDGVAIEEVHFLRDEIANVVWAVERITPHPIGMGRAAPDQVVRSGAPTPPGLRWTLTPPPPPGQWFPLLPVAVGRLALGALWNARDQTPQGRLLAGLSSPRQLHQEEVPPEGAQVTRQWQTARAIDGSLHFWIGRSKTPRQTDTAPAIRFDIVDWV
jgi:hypothetical protein